MPPIAILRWTTQATIVAAVSENFDPVAQSCKRAGSVRCPVGLWAGWLMLLLSGCANPKQRTDLLPLPLAASQESRTRALESCRQVPRGAEPLLHRGAVTLLGEVHGTVEIPAFVARLACAAAERGLHVAVGLEAPQELTENFLRYLQSAGDAQAQQDLIQGEFWHFDDGRSSQALVSLLDTLRTLRQSGKQVSLFLIDGNNGSIETRDRQMATRIATQVRALPAAVVLVLLGNLHARTDSAEWAGWHIKELLPGLRTLNASYASGSAWCCTNRGCGAHQISGADLGMQPFVELFPSTHANGYTGRFYVGPITPSPPAAIKGDAPP